MKIDFQFRNDGAPISPATLAELDRRLSVSLPEDYRQFLLSHNGGFPSHEVFFYGEDKSFVLKRFYQVGNDDTFHVCLFRDGNGEPVADLVEIGISSFGDPVCLAVGEMHHGSVWWYDHEHDPDDDPHNGLTQLAATFEQFVTGLELM